MPVELFDSVADNFLQNALAKRRSHPGIRIRATLAWEAGCTLSVCDSGDALSEQIAQHLFSAPVPSLQGLGVGLVSVRTSGHRRRISSRACEQCQRQGVLRDDAGGAKEIVTEASPQSPYG